MLNKLTTRLSSAFCSYGRACAARPIAVLFIALSLVSLVAFPVLSRFVHTLHLASLPRDSADAQFWQYSPHVQPNHANSARHIDSNTMLAFQIRVASIEPISKAFLNDVWDFWHTFTATPNDAAISFGSFCHPRRGSACTVHSALDYWPSREAFDADNDWKATVDRQRHTLSPAGLVLDPFSVFGHVVFDEDNRMVSADSVIFTILVEASRERLWQSLWQSMINHQICPGHQCYYQQAEIPSQTWQYKFNAFAYDIPLSVYLCVLGHVALFIGLAHVFGKSQLVKSPYGLATGAVFTSVACVTVSLGILNALHVQLDKVPWFLFPFIANVAMLENVFILTQAAQSAGCDMHVKEKLGRGLESIGVPMTGTLIAELIITAIGSATAVQGIRQLCLFSSVVLVVDYVLELSFFLAILAIDVRRIELADLDDRQVSKRLRELANGDVDPDTVPVDYCPIQEETQINCADCKDFKTHRAYNALTLCILILTLTVFQSPLSHRSTPWPVALPDAQQRLAAANGFWNAVNPYQEPKLLRVEAPYLIVYADEAEAGQMQLDFINKHYQLKADSLFDTHRTMATRRQPSRFRSFLYTVFGHLHALFQVNVPLFLLTNVLVGIIIWLQPSWRRRFLQPLLHTAATLAETHVSQLASRVAQSSSAATLLQPARQNDYDKDGVHRGAISVQQQFQRKSQVNAVKIQTLSGKHIADVHRFDIHAKSGLALSCGQDGRLIAWDADRGQWVARLDRMRQTHAGLEGDRNPAYWPQQNAQHNPPARIASPQPNMSAARCVKIDQGNKWLVAGFDDSVIRVWRAATGTLVRELRVEHDLQAQDAEQIGVVRNRRQHRRVQDAPTPTAPVDRVLAMAFVGAVPEYCHPLVAQVAARVRSTDPEAAQNHLVSVHKSGRIREWDILTGECIQSIPSGHTGDITVLHVVESKAPHRQWGVTWVFTAGKDGQVKCWERRLVKDENEPSRQSTTWTCAYSHTPHRGHAITSLATELPVGGMGVVVTGASDGSVELWNFETGEAVSTLSAGFHPSSSKRKHVESIVGGPLLQYSQFSTHPKPNANQEKPTPDHTSAIVQVVVSRYCDVENGRGMCRGCDTCFGNGFLVASCSTDHKVHVWRLERTGGHDSSCSLCSKDYHRKQYKRTSPASTAHDSSSSPRRSRRQSRSSSSSGSGSITLPRRRPHVPRPRVVTPGDDGLLDIEQLAGDGEGIELSTMFLGTIDQVGGRGLAFCHDNVLGGVRQTQTDSAEPQWEAWFASLHYYEPPSGATLDQMQIPVETFSLDAEPAVPTPPPEPIKSKTQRFPLWRMGDGRLNSSHLKQIDRQWRKQDDEDCGEADEILPFSVVRHVVSLDGMGLACDYGNFIKIVYVDNELYQQRKTSAWQTRTPSTEQAAGECTCDGSCDDKSTCCKKTGNKQNCCGGKRKPRREKKPVPKPSLLRCTVRSVAECSSITDCPRAGDCRTTRVTPKGSWQ